MKRAMSLLLLILSMSTCISACSGIRNTSDSVNQAYWPEESWRTSTPEEQGMDSAMLANMINDIRQGAKGVDSVTIIRHGYKVNETYFYPYQKNWMHALNSVTKSFTSALMGIAIDDGAVKGANDKALDYFPDMNIENMDALKRKIEIRDLLSMSTGLDWHFYEDPSSDHMVQSANFTKYTLDLPMKEEPGRTFIYSDGAIQVAASIIQRATNMSPAALMADKFKALGIRDFYWGTTPERVSRGYAGLFMYPDDLAKFGYLYLRKGDWMGQQIISSTWIAESTATRTNPDWGPMFPGYGYCWWIPRFGGYAAMGNGANFIFVLPDLDMVTVFTGGIFDNSNMFYPAELMEKYILPSVKSGVPLPANNISLESLSKAVDAAQTGPAPHPVNQLPDMAKTISGKPFEFEDGTTMTLTFMEGSNEFTFDINNKIELAVGLDGRYRSADTGNAFGSLPDHNHMAFMGGWPDANTLQIIEHNMEDAIQTVYEFQFLDGTIEMKMDSNFNSGVTQSTSTAMFID